MKQRLFPTLIASLLLSLMFTSVGMGQSPFPGERGRDLDRCARNDIWSTERPGFLANFVKVPRDQVVAFALYTHDNDVLKMTAQLFPLMPHEARTVRLEILWWGQWREIAQAEVVYPGWSAHFRVEDWSSKRTIPYRVRHGETAMFKGTIRKDPIRKDEIVVGSLSCSSNADREDRDTIVNNLLEQDPDLLFFAGDQSYDHKEHTAAWLLWGHQFREVIKDRPVVTIPDDHDVGHGNLWGEGGIVAESSAGNTGGYYYPAEYIRMVERCQTWHLPDAVDPQPVAQNIGVYFTRLRVGGVDFAVLEDRKFKTGPNGTIPQMGPRPDHIREAGYDPKKIDLPGLKLLGDRQLFFLNTWSQDWTGAEMKAVLSQSAFCGAVHCHGSKENRLLADLDCNGWPQTGRRKALEAMRRALACHLSGDQHLSAVVQHGIDAHRDGPLGFTSPAIINSYYGRWWWPADEAPGANPMAGSPLPWTGDYLDGLYNRITMMAYANPGFDNIEDMRDNQRNPAALLGDGYGLVRFNKKTQEVTFECWPRYADLAQGNSAQYPGWPITFKAEQNDGRRIIGHLPELQIRGSNNPVVQVSSDDTGEILYTRRIQGKRFRAPVYAPGSYTIRVGKDWPDIWSKPGVTVGSGDAIRVSLSK